ILRAKTRRNLEDLQKELVRSLNFIFVEHISEVLEAALRPTAGRRKAAAARSGRQKYGVDHKRQSLLGF
ncbi:hypothetical protein, partial [Vibrio alginolyticus]|uniref:hypothetical protein n=1 Tax=Vibrio alginolyticus TaxID=663 RepID=UPI001A8ED18F